MQIFKNKELDGLLKGRWDSLPQLLRTPNQVVGKHWVQCGFTMGPPQCSFGCSHCYLPANANRANFPDLESMKHQIDRNREMLGPGGNIQITGGDLVDAYLGRGIGDQLIEIVAYAVERQLVPMLMTHGQGLMDNPGFLYDLVQHGGLRKLSCHIDITQGGRPGYPVRSLENEKQLNPVRDQLVRLVLDTRKKTGKRLTAAQTVTVASNNIGSINEILEWLVSSPANLDVTRTVSFQTEARVGRTRPQPGTVTPEQVWQEICFASGQEFSRNHMLFGHPECSSKATILARSRDQKIVNLGPDEPSSIEFWGQLMDACSARVWFSDGSVMAKISRILMAACRPRLLYSGMRWVISLYARHGLTTGILLSVLRGQAKGLNIVLHNFINAEEVLNPTTDVTADRLNACSFRGALEVDGKWVPVPMCRVNAEHRPALYSASRENSAENKVVKIQSISTLTLKPPLPSGVIKPSQTA